MSHSHSHAVENIKLAFFLNLAFTILEIFGGLFTNSMAILADALHDFGDSIALGLSWYFAISANVDAINSFLMVTNAFPCLAR
jgi:cobalt-zinc-cadmium efflux system protein